MQDAVVQPSANGLWVNVIWNVILLRKLAEGTPIRLPFLMPCAYVNAIVQGPYLNLLWLVITSHWNFDMKPGPCLSTQK